MEDSKLVSYCLYTLYTMCKWFKNVSSHFSSKDGVRSLKGGEGSGEGSEIRYGWC